MLELPKLEEWLREHEKRRQAQMAVRGVLNEMRRHKADKVAIFYNGGRSFSVVKADGRVCREKIRFEEGEFLGVFERDIWPDDLAKELKAVL